MSGNSEGPVLSLANVKGLLEKLKSAQTDFDATTALLAKADESEWSELLPFPLYWSLLYELNYSEHLTLLLCCLGIADDLRELQKGPGGKRATLDLLSDLDSMDISTFKFPDGFDRSDLFVCLASIMFSLTSWGVYGRTLSGLVLDVRKGKKASFFKAVRVDKSALTCPTMAHFLSRAVLSEKPNFFAKLSNVIRTGRKRPRSDFEPLRFALSALKEDGQLEAMSGNERYEVFCEKLKVYTAERKEDPAEGLRMFISRWRKEIDIYRT